PARRLRDLIQVTVITGIAAALCQHSDVPQDTGFVLLDHPIHDRQPVEARLEPEQMGRLESKPRRLTSAIFKLETRTQGPERTDRVLRIDVVVRAQLADRRYVVQYDERQPVIGGVIRYPLNGGAG